MAKWVNKAPMPVLRSDMSCHYFAGKVYMAGGCSSEQVYESNYSACDSLSQRMDVYHQATDTWTRGANMPRVRNRHTGVAYDGFVYLFGGRNEADAVVREVDVYNIDGDSWTTLADLFTFATSDLASYVQGTKVVMMGGYDDVYASMNGTHVFDLATKTFQYNVAYMTQSRGDLCAVNILDKGYIFGGFNDADFNEPLDTLDTFTLTSKTYNRVNEFSTAKDGGDSGCSMVNNVMYVLGGESKVDIGGNIYSDPLDTAQSFDPQTGKWKVEADMKLPHPRFRQCTVNIDGQIHLMGGQGPLTLDGTEHVHLILSDNMVFVPNAASALSASALTAALAAVVLGFFAGKKI